jgi:hypothetical protein
MAQILKPNRKDNRGGHKPKLKLKLLPKSIRLYDVERPYLQKYIKSVRAKFNKPIDYISMEEYEKFVKRL